MGLSFPDEETGVTIKWKEFRGRGLDLKDSQGLWGNCRRERAFLPTGNESEKKKCDGNAGEKGRRKDDNKFSCFKVRKTAKGGVGVPTKEETHVVGELGNKDEASLAVTGK